MSNQLEREGHILYKLSCNGVQEFVFSVQPGPKGNGHRLSDDKLTAIAEAIEEACKGVDFDRVLRKAPAVGDKVVINYNIVIIGEVICVHKDTMFVVEERTGEYGQIGIDGDWWDYRR